MVGSKMKHHGGIGVRVILAVAFGLFSLPALVFGSYLLSCWFRIHTTDLYYVDYPYVRVAFIWIGLGVSCVLLTLYGASRTSVYGLLFSIPLLLGFASKELIPNTKPHLARSMVADMNFLWHVQSLCRDWYLATHKFPASDNDVRKAGSRIPATSQAGIELFSAESYYSLRGNRLAYDIVVISNASGPHMTELSDRPGVIYYSVSSDLQKMWITMTALHDDVAYHADLKRAGDRPDKRVWVVEAVGTDYPMLKN
jgi:hypothetical protein